MQVSTAATRSLLIDLMNSSARGDRFSNSSAASYKIAAGDAEPGRNTSCDDSATEEGVSAKVERIASGVQTHVPQFVRTRTGHCSLFECHRSPRQDALGQSNDICEVDHVKTESCRLAPSHLLERLAERSNHDHSPTPSNYDRVVAAPHDLTGSALFSLFR